jgi:hypothetical protein
MSATKVVEVVETDEDRAVRKRRKNGRQALDGALDALEANAERCSREVKKRTDSMRIIAAAVTAKMRGGA